MRAVLGPAGVDSMWNCRCKRAALTAALSIAVAIAATPSLASPPDWSPYFGFSKNSRKALVHKRKISRHAEKSLADKLTVPPGPLQIIVSIKSQRVTLYANGVEITHGPVSTGTASHPTPMGFFTVIQKDRHHVSNLYDASMPYMQRITWSGSAMHQGPLPGYPASHGCIRLTTDFAQMLWKTTKLGARVVIARDDVAPVDIDHPSLFVPKPKVGPHPTLPVKTADGTDVVPGIVVPDGTPKPQTVAANPLNTAAKPLNDRKSEQVASARDVKRRSNPVSVFVSRKDNRLYVRQAMQPLFDVPVTIRNADEPIGTHVFTAIALKADGTAMRWNSISVPSSYPRAAQAPRKGKPHKPEPVVTAEPMPMPSAAAALDRLELPADLRDDIGALLSPGSSLIISDNSIKSGETGSYTDFIVLTK